MTASAHSTLKWTAVTSEILNDLLKPKNRLIYGKLGTKLKILVCNFGARNSKKNTVKSPIVLLSLTFGVVMRGGTNRLAFLWGLSADLDFVLVIVSF